MTLIKFFKNTMSKLLISSDLKIKSMLKEAKESFFQTFLGKFKHNLKMQLIFIHKPYLNLKQQKIKHSVLN